MQIIDYYCVYYLSMTRSVIFRPFCPSIAFGYQLLVVNAAPISADQSAKLKTNVLFNLLTLHCIASLYRYYIISANTNNNNKNNINNNKLENDLINFNTTQIIESFVTNIEAKNVFFSN